MTVGELVAKLQKFSQDDLVALSIVEGTRSEHLSIFKDNAYVLLSPHVYMTKGNKSKLVNADYIRVMEDEGWTVVTEA